MEHTVIRLKQNSWIFDSNQALGPAGGFGAVFAGSAEDGSPVAVKRIFLQKSELAARELEISEYFVGHDFPHVVPILDVGYDETSERFYIVMARADMNLQEMIERHAPFSEADAIEIIDAIAAGLDELSDIVHRDLKPANVLLHHGIWKLADLGLARLVDSVTSSQTVKEFATAPYAAPEQWRDERATKATDIYAAGCILFALITGKPPFPGPLRSDYQRQHLQEPPPKLVVSPAFERVAMSCLAKSPLVRPSVQSLRSQLQNARSANRKPTLNALARAAATLERKRADEEAARNTRAAVEKARRDGSAASLVVLSSIIDELSKVIKANVPNAQISRSADGLDIKLGGATLTCAIDFPEFIQPQGWFGPGDILAGAFVGVHDGWVASEKVCRSANLWYAKLTSRGDFRWWEIGYRESENFPELNLLKSKSQSTQIWEHQWGPFGISAPLTDRYYFGNDTVSRMGQGWLRLAHNPRPVDGEHVEEFCGRWATWLVKAALRDLSDETRLPEEDILPQFDLVF